jgi:hypothetical protein
MRRRDLLLPLMLSSNAANWPLFAQTPKLWRLGVLSPIDTPLIRSIVIRDLARDLVSTAPDAIMAVSDWAVHPVRHVTSSIPIIMLAST